MIRKNTALLTSTLVAVAIAATACGAAPGSDSNGDTSSGSNAALAKSTAQQLGIDLSKCGIDPTKKFTGTVKIGQTLPQTGGPAAAAFAPIGVALKAAFEAFNATSGLPVKFEVVQADDQFNPAKALAATEKLIDSDKVVALTSTIGTPSVAAVAPLLDQQCVPMVTGLAGAQVADNPKKHPWTTIFTLPSSVDARAWVENVVETYPNGAKIGMFYANDESGKAYLAAVKKYLAGTKSTLVSTQTIEDSDSAAPASQVTTLRASGANVLLAAPTGAQCVSLMKQVASVGWKPRFYVSSSCPATLFDVAGSAANNVIVNQYTKDPARAPFNTDPAVLKAVAAMKKYAPQLKVNNTAISGFFYAEPFFAAVKAAAASPLGLTSLGLLAATVHLNFQLETGFPGVKFNLNYPSDEVALEAAEMRQYVSASKLFTDIKLYNFEGQMTGIASVK
jgi:branched-chain amino acid transport system substrate-binding protein